MDRALFLLYHNNLTFNLFTIDAFNLVPGFCYDFCYSYHKQISFQRISIKLWSKFFFPSLATQPSIWPVRNVVLAVTRMLTSVEAVVCSWKVHPEDLPVTHSWVNERMHWNLSRYAHAHTHTDVTSSMFTRFYIMVLPHLSLEFIYMSCSSSEHGEVCGCSDSDCWPLLPLQHRNAKAPPAKRGGA